MLKETARNADPLRKDLGLLPFIRAPDY